MGNVDQQSMPTYSLPLSVQYCPLLTWTFVPPHKPPPTPKLPKKYYKSISNKKVSTRIKAEIFGTKKRIQIHFKLENQGKEILYEPEKISGL